MTIKVEGKVSMQHEPQTETLHIHIPIRFVKRGGLTRIVLPEGYTPSAPDRAHPGPHVAQSPGDRVGVAGTTGKRQSQKSEGAVCETGKNSQRQGLENTAAHLSGPGYSGSHFNR